MKRVLVFGDSLTFHGPVREVIPDDPRLFTNIALAEFGASLDLEARLGWNSRDAWWALTKDPVAWGRYLPRASALVLAVGTADYLPNALPQWLRDGIPYLRPGSLRRRVRKGYSAVSPWIRRTHGGRYTHLAPRATSHYLDRIVQGVRTLRPGLPIVRMLPAYVAADHYPGSDRGLPRALAAGEQWAERHDIPTIDPNSAIRRHWAEQNPDGLHWGWETHRVVGELLARALQTVAEPVAHSR